MSDDSSSADEKTTDIEDVVIELEELRSDLEAFGDLVNARLEQVEMSARKVAFWTRASACILIAFAFLTILAALAN